MTWPPPHDSKLITAWEGDNIGHVIANAETPVGVLRWNGSQWFFFPMSENGKTPADGVLIDIDPEQDDAFREEAIEIAQIADLSVRAVRELELQGRRNMFRDENRDLASIGGRIEARRWLKMRQPTALGR